MLNMSGSPNMRKFKNDRGQDYADGDETFPTLRAAFAIQANQASTGVTQGKHRPADYETSAVNAVADHCHRIVGKQHAEAERQNGQCCGLLVGL